MRGTASWHREAVRVLAVVGVVTALVFALVAGSEDPARRTPARFDGEPAAGPRLVSVAPLPDDPFCDWTPATIHLNRAAEFFFPHVFSATPATLAALQSGQGPAALAGARPDDATRLAASQRRPVRIINDRFPSFSSVA